MVNKAVIDIEGETQGLETYWKTRNEQILTDRNLLYLTKPLAVKDKIQWVLPEPKILYDTCVALMSAHPPRFRLPLTINYEPDERIAISKAERFLLGIFRYLNTSQMDKGKNYWYRELSHWVASGWYAVFVNIEKKDGQVYFRADLFDPLTVYPEWDADGLIRCIRSYQTDLRTAKAMAEGWSVDFDYNESTVKVINYWRKLRGVVYNAILMGGKVIKPLTPTKFPNIPIFIGAIGNPEKSAPDWQKRMGESVLAADRDLFAYQNTITSLEAQIMAETAYPNIITKTDTGEPAVRTEELKGHGQVIPLRQTDQLEAFVHAATPAEARSLSAVLANLMQRGGLPYIVYGGVDFELSGFAISQLMAAIKYKLSPYLNTNEQIISKVSAEFLRQFREGDFGTITLSTTNPREIAKGLFFVEEFSKADIPEVNFVDVKIPMTSSMDKTQQIMFAKQALAPPQVLSRETLWDEVLEVQDGEQEYARIIQDEILEIPIVKELAALEQLRDQVEKYTTQGKLGEAEALRRYLEKMEMELGVRKAVIAKPGEPPPSVLPPEAQAPSPDALRSILGQAPPSPTRTPREGGR